MRTLTFKCPPSHWEELKVNVTKDTGIVLAGDEGEGTAKGIHYTYKYDPTDQILTIEELSRSWYDPSEDEIAQKLNDQVNKLIDSIP